MANVRKILDLCTSHVPEHIAESVKAVEGIVAVMSSEYGWLMWVPQGANWRDEFPECPPECARIIDYARSHGCSYVMFDCDAEEDPALPTWDW